MYATVEDLAERIPWSELAEAAARDDPEVTGEALRVYVENTDGDATAPVAVGWSDDRIPLAAELTADADSGVVVIPQGAGSQHLLVWRAGDAGPAELSGAGLVRTVFGAPAPLEHDGQAGRVIVSTGTLNTALLAGEYLGVDCEPVPSGDAPGADALARAAAWLRRIVDDASTEIDGYLTGRYGAPADHPLMTPDGLRTLRTRAVDIATYRLLGGETNAERYQVWRRAIEWLESVAAGRVDLFAPQPAVDARFEFRASEFGRAAIAGL